MRGITIGTAVCLAVLMGCETAPKGQQQSERLNSAVQKLGANAGDAESNLRITWEAYTNLLNSEGDLKAPYAKFDSGLKSCESLVASMDKALAGANAAAASYFTTYEADLEKIEDEGIRESSRTRLESRRSAYTAFQTHLQAGIDIYKPILAKLRAHAQALGLELTAATIAAAKSDEAAVKKMAEDWYKRNEEVKTDVDKFLTENAPTAAAGS
jgi:hypothetical protein